MRVDPIVHRGIAIKGEIPLGTIVDRVPNSYRLPLVIRDVVRISRDRTRDQGISNHPQIHGLEVGGDTALPFLVVRTSQERNLGIYFDVRLHSLLWSVSGIKFEVSNLKC